MSAVSRVYHLAMSFTMKLSLRQAEMATHRRQLALKEINAAGEQRTPGITGRIPSYE